MSYWSTGTALHCLSAQPTNYVGIHLLEASKPSLSYLHLQFALIFNHEAITMFLELVVSVLAILLGPFYFIYKTPQILIRYCQRRWPDVLWQVEMPKGPKVVALTIHDGPSEYTNEILQILKTNNAQATFFIIGSQIAGHESTLQELIRNGNELANHAMYDEPSKALSNAVLRKQIQDVDTMLRDAYEATGIEGPPKYFRPGSGFFHARMRQLLLELGYRLVLGSIYPHDPQIPYWSINAGHILSMVRPGGIIICHDRRSYTAPMLRKVLPELRMRGYRVVTVSALLADSET